jgi:hypothetical protein
MLEPLIAAPFEMKTLSSGILFARTTLSTDEWVEAVCPRAHPRHVEAELAKSTRELAMRTAFG